jgi:hypothetical protein
VDQVGNGEGVQASCGRAFDNQAAAMRSCRRAVSPPHAAKDTVELANIHQKNRQARPVYAEDCCVSKNLPEAASASRTGRSGGKCERKVRALPDMKSCSGICQGLFHLVRVGHVERRHPATVRQVGIGSVPNEQPDDLELPAVDSTTQRRLSPGIEGVDGRAMFDKRLHDRNEAMARGLV